MRIATATIRSTLDAWRPRPSPAAASLYRRLARSRFAVKVTRYAIGSVVALLTSVVVFALLLGAGVGTTADSILAFMAGARAQLDPEPALGVGAAPAKWTWPERWSATR